MRPKYDRFRMTHYEREFATFDKYVDHDRLFWELHLNPRLGAAIREAVQRKLALKQAEFDRMMAARPETIADRERWQRNREEMEQRRAAAERQVEKVSVRQAVRILARNWRVPLVIRERRASAEQRSCLA